MFDEGPEALNQPFAGREVFFHSTSRICGQVFSPRQYLSMSTGAAASRFILVVFSAAAFRAMELITILNRCHRFRGFVYRRARFSAHGKSIEVAIRPRKGSAAICLRLSSPRAPVMIGCEKGGSSSFCSGLVFFLASMRRVDCPRCRAVVVEEVPWADGRMPRSPKPTCCIWPAGPPALLERNGRSLLPLTSNGTRSSRCRRARGLPCPGLAP